MKPFLLVGLGLGLATLVAAGQAADSAGADAQASSSLPPVLTAEAFDQLWEAFDLDYAMFALRPEVDWNRLRELYRPKALASRSTNEFAAVCAELLKPLRDLHIWLTVAGEDVPVFNRPRSANANPGAHTAILGQLHEAGQVQWAITPDRIGFLAIYGWSDKNIPALCHQALEQMRDTRGLVVDVRLNGGGSEDLAEEVAGRFLQKEFVYAFSQFRNGPSHTNLTTKLERRVSPKGPWRYDRPVVLLIGQKCMSSNESFIAMMSGAQQVTIMGDHTCGSSGNPKIIYLPLDITVSVPRWIDYLPDGTPLDERGFQPQLVFETSPGAFEGLRDDLLTAALGRLRSVPLPEQPIAQPAFVPQKEDAAEFSAALGAVKPEIVELTPGNGARDVDPSLTELHVTFNMSMAGGFSWTGGGEHFPTIPKGQRPHWTADRKTCVLPVELKPDWEYHLGLNSPSFRNFRSAEGVPLNPVPYTFRTRAP
ncbi:MAG TPA: S41 family peptidase [Verrucomicrobiae bacterium]|nr:S41 family peptidase [Verrucomicrobiae bacterium]